MQIEREDKATRLLSDLFALVRGECPRLLSEDSGMDAALCLDIEEHLRSAARSQPGAACPSDCAENRPPSQGGKYRCTRCGRDEIDGRENGCARGPCPMEFIG